MPSIKLRETINPRANATFQEMMVMRAIMYFWRVANTFDE
jgi:hypothetical protein